MKNEANAKDLTEDLGEVVHCGEARVLETKTYEENGTEFTEELLELIDPEGRASTIRVTYTAGSNYMNVTFSESGHGSGAWCSYQVGSKALNAPYYDYKFTTTRYSTDVARTFNSAPLFFPVPGPSEQLGMYHFLKYIRNSATQTNPTRTYEWVRSLRGSGTAS